jgi:hypothetical protein
VQIEGIRGGRADIMVQLPGDRPLTLDLGGRLFAFEVQYSSLSPAGWQRHPDRYQAAGVNNVWLFGFGEQDREPTRPTLAPVHEAVLRAGQPLRWILPRFRAASRQRGHPHGWCPPRLLGRQGGLGADLG